MMEGGYVCTSNEIWFDGEICPVVRLEFCAVSVTVSAKLQWLCHVSDAQIKKQRAELLRESKSLNACTRKFIGCSRLAVRTGQRKLPEGQGKLFFFIAIGKWGTRSLMPSC